MRIALTSVYVEHVERAFRFYTEVLGFVSRMHIPEASLAIVVSPEEPDGTGLLLEPNENPIARTYQTALFQAGLPSIVLGVADLQREYARLQQHGVVFRAEPAQTDAGMVALIEDGCGNLLQLFQAP